MLISTEPTSTLGALVLCRQTVLTRASELLNESVEPSEHGDRLPAVAGLLMTSLEELKVAEEELREQNAALAARQAAEDRRLFHYRQLFLQSPMPVLITDMNATIVETNVAAATLFKREARYLERKPVAALVDASERDTFRKQLARLTIAREVTDWVVTFSRVGDTPIRAHATVKPIDGLGLTGSGVLYWLLSIAPIQA